MNQQEVINGNDYSTMKECGNYVKLLSASNTSNRCPITKLSNREYRINRSGEIKEYNYSNSSHKSRKRLNNSCRELKDLVLTNTKQYQNCLGITLTYASEMRDLDRAGKDFKRFIEKCRRAYGKFEYINVIEPQKRGSWHHHVVFIFDKKAPFIDNAEISPKWKHGFTYTEKVESDIEIATYLANYNLDLYYSAAVELYPEQVGSYPQYTKVKDDGTVETIVRGIAIRMISKSMNIYRHSQNIQKPIIRRGEKKILLSNKKYLVLENSYIATKWDDDNRKIVNQVKYEMYSKKNRNRK